MKDFKFFSVDCCGDPNLLILDDDALLKYFNISKRTSAEWRNKRLITYFKIGKKVYYKLSDVEKMLENHKIPSRWEKRNIGII
jgi:Helix-turn-helix domain